MRVYLDVSKSLYRIRKELEEEGIFVTPDYLYHFARRHKIRLRVVKEAYEREVFGVDENDAELLKKLVKQAITHPRRHRPCVEKGFEERDEGRGTRDAKG